MMPRSEIIIGKQKFTCISIPIDRETGEAVDETLDTDGKCQERTDRFAICFGLKRNDAQPSMR